MKIKSAAFVVSNTDYKMCPDTHLPEYAFIGRSNVGKSSLINALTNTKNLAKISSTPGKTQLINHFVINNKWYLVDLPGTGYARVSKEKRSSFSKMNKEYLLNRKNLTCLFFLIDCRLKPQKIDQDFMKWLAEFQIPFVIVFTKSDKLNRNLLHKNIKSYREYMKEEWIELPKIFITSSKEKKNTNDIVKYIDSLNQKNQ